MQTIYANSVTLHVTDQEVIFEFGTELPQRSEHSVKKEYSSEVRVAMPRNIIQRLKDILDRIIKAPNLIAKGGPDDNPGSVN